jgi:hypothetical protein
VAQEIAKRRDLVRKHRHPVLEALAVAHQNLAPLEIHILDTQAQGLHQAQAGAIQQASHQPMHALQVGQHLAHLVLGQHHRQAARLLRLLHIVQPRQLAAQHILVEKEQGAARLILRRCRHVSLNRQMRQKRLDLHRPHLGRMPLAVKKNEAPYPLDIGILGPYAVVLKANPLANAIQ